MRKTVLFITVCCSFILYAGEVSADTLLKWDDVVAQTIELQPDLKGAALRVQEARYDEKISKSSLLGQISGTSSYRRTDSSASDWKDAYSHGISGSLLLFDGFKTPYAVKAAGKKIDEQQFAYEVASSDALLNIRLAFVGLMESQELVMLTKNISDRKKQNLELVELRYEGGKEHKGAYLTAEAEFAEAEFDVRQAERNLILSRRKLLIAMGTEEIQEIRVSGAFTLSGSISQKPELSGLMNEVPFLKQLAAAREAAKFNNRSTLGELWPSISATSSLGRSGNDFWGDEKDISFGLSVSIPLFEGGKNKASINKSHVAFLRSQANEQSGRQQVLLLLENNWKVFQDAIETVDVRKKFLQATQERAKIAAAQYGTGLIDFDSWIIIENNLVTAQKNYLLAQSGMLKAEADWIHSLGGTLDDQIY